MEGGGDLDFLALDLRQGEGHRQFRLDFGGDTGTTSTMRPRLSARLIRASSGVSPASPLPRSATAPTPGALSPPPDTEAETEPVTTPSVNGISALWTDPATDFSTKDDQRAAARSLPDTKLALS
jgi:hypothetical protein